SGEDFGFPAGIAGGFISLFGTIFFSMMYAIIMSVITAIILGLYNIISHYLGGIKLYLQTENSFPTNKETAD
ncbi:hypothetical protein DRQ09_07590, partial [candidate division KSB1 bacterium]